MTTFTRDWNSAYMGVPANTEDARKGAQRLRELKNDILERMSVDHSWVGDAKDGQHLKVTMIPATVEPSTVAGEGIIFAKLVGTTVQLFYKDSNGTVTQMSFVQGTPSSIILPGTILPIGNGDFDMSPAYLQCKGQAVNRVTYADLFNAIGIIWGGGDGITTFNVPDLRGRTLIGLGQGSGLTNRTSGQIMGEETHALTIGELPAHNHLLIANTNGAGGNGTVGYKMSDVANTTAGVDSTPGAIDTAHQNMQPSAVVNYVIKT